MPVRASRVFTDAETPELNPVPAGHCVYDVIEHRIDDLLSIPLAEVQVLRSNALRKF
jgi:hypothetical protein